MSSDLTYYSLPEFPLAHPLYSPSKYQAFSFLKASKSTLEVERDVYVRLSSYKESWMRVIRIQLFFGTLHGIILHPGAESNRTERTSLNHSPLCSSNVL